MERELHNMKKRIVSSLMVVALFTFLTASTSFALTLKDNVNVSVGEIDELMAYTVLTDSSIGGENNWAAPIVLATDGVVVNFTTKTSTSSNVWRATTQDNVYAYQLSGGNDYFILKTGDLYNGKPVDQPSDIKQYDHFLFRNNAEDSWAVIDLNGLIGDNDPETYLSSFNVNAGKISHVTTGSNTPVPEPRTMVLLGAGMLGLAIFGKRRMNRE
jgi:hypothetical protein